MQERIKQRKREECHGKDKQVKQSVREDKRKWMDERAAAVIVRELKRQEVSVKDK